MSGVRDDLVRLLRSYGAESERLAQVVAERPDMHPTDLYALLAATQADAAGASMTPGRLGTHLGLSSGATTAVIDRLEGAENVQRARDDCDRRPVTLHFGDAAAAVAQAFFGPFGGRMDRVLTHFTPDELDAVRRFLAEMNELMREYRREVTAAG